MASFIDEGDINLFPSIYFQVQSADSFSATIGYKHTAPVQSRRYSQPTVAASIAVDCDGGGNRYCGILEAANAKPSSRAMKNETALVTKASLRGIPAYTESM